LDHRTCKSRTLSAIKNFKAFSINWLLMMSFDNPKTLEYLLKKKKLNDSRLKRN